jgi:hypothetical protein
MKQRVNLEVAAHLTGFVTVYRILSHVFHFYAVPSIFPICFHTLSVGT